MTEGRDLARAYLKQQAELGPARIVVPSGSPHTPPDVASTDASTDTTGDQQVQTSQPMPAVTPVDLANLPSGITIESKLSWA